MATHRQPVGKAKRRNLEPGDLESSAGPCYLAVMSLGENPSPQQPLDLWASRLAGGAYRPGAPHTERWEGGMFCLHLRPEARVPNDSEDSEGVRWSV